MFALDALRNRGGVALAGRVDHFNGCIVKIRLVNAAAKFQFQIARVDQSVNHERGVI